MRFFKLPVLFGLAALLLSAVPASLYGEDGAAGLSPGTYVVFVSGERGDRSIVMMDSADGAPLLLADLPGAVDTQPAVGPQGQLAWIRRNAGAWELMENGRIFSGGALHLSPAYMPDGTLTAAVSGESSTNIYAFGNGGKRLLVESGTDDLAVSPTFSPDGSQMAYVSNQGEWAQIFVTRPGQGNGRAISSGQVRNTDPRWSPTGEFIAFVTAEKDICLIRPDGSGRRQLTSNQGLNRGPAFSPDGRQIIFSSDRQGMNQLFVMNLDGSGQRLLFPGLSAPQSQPVWTAVRPQIAPGH